MFSIEVLGQTCPAAGAMRPLMLTDLSGVLDENGEVIPHLSKDRALAMIKSGAIAGGIIPKVKTCLAALAAGVGGVVILDGRVEHAVLLELFTEHGAGTLIS